MKKRLSRREFLKRSALTSAALPVLASANATVRQVRPVPPNPGPGSWCRWLDGHPPQSTAGVTWGVPWQRGQHSASARFALRDPAGREVAVQSWPLAYWPDGSLKWTAHALPAALSAGPGPFQIVAVRRSGEIASSVRAHELNEGFEIDTGVIRCRIARRGPYIIRSILREGRVLLSNAHLILQYQDAPDDAAVDALQKQTVMSFVESVQLEQRGPARAVVKIDGRHGRANERLWLPFTLRLYFYAGSDAVRVLHSIVFDGDESRDFIKGIGLRFDVRLGDPLQDRHVRFAGEEHGVFGEAVRGLTGLRRDPGEAARAAQVAGRASGALAAAVEERLHLVPAFGDWTLVQPTADSFVIRKRTAAGHSWLHADQGRRAAGLAYVGGATRGGVAFGIRNFWQSHPAQLDVRGASGRTAQATAWMWAPEAPAMDLRFYHDGLGQDTYEKQLQGLQITYEDYEPGFGTPLGVARTSELMLHVLPATPTREAFVTLAESLRTPPVLVATPQTLREAGVFAQCFALPDRSTPAKAPIEDRLDALINFYLQQQEERRWYGFWNYGDVMHSYDVDRHVWRYDVGGYAWDNSELSTDIWLWLQFMRTGDADLFRFAEAMTRHTGEVDVHHLGKFAPLGSRHNVMHWGCSAKQLRISTALNRRYYYYLTADERVGDLMREQIEGGRTLRTIQATRKLPASAHRRPDDPNGDYAHMSFGTDWGSLAGAWLTEWERTRDQKMRTRLLNSMRSIAAQPHGFFSGSARLHLDNGTFQISEESAPAVSHLSAAFGLPEVCAELIELLPHTGFERAWLQYCELYNAGPQEQRAALGITLAGVGLQQGHSRLTAYAAHRKRDAKLAARAWQEFRGGRSVIARDSEIDDGRRAEPQRIAGNAVLNPISEVGWISTNAAAQWSLAAIECLAFAPLE